MSAPASVLVVTNVSQAAFWAGGLEVAVSGQQTYQSANIQAVFSDVNFWAAFLDGAATITLNGIPIPNNSGPVVAFMLEVAVGNITPT